MPVELRVVDDIELVIMELKGTITLDDLNESAERLSSLRQQVTNYDLLIGGPNNDLAVESQDLRKFAAGDSILSSESRRVILATTPLTFGISRMYASSGNEKVTVCDSIEEVARFLEVDLDNLNQYCRDWPA